MPEQEFKTTIQCSARIKDAGVAICIREEGYFYTLQGLEMGWRGWTPVGGDIKSKLTLRQIYFSVIEKYVEDVKQDEKSVPDLVESMMKVSGLGEE